MKEFIVRENGSLRVRTINTEPSRTQEHFKDECDVNNIMKKYRNSGQVTHLARTSGVYADLTSIKDYHSAMNQVVQAQEAFATLPASVRERFANDPARLLDFIKDEKNYDEGVKYGLFEKRPDTPPKNPEPSNKAPKQNDQKSKTNETKGAPKTGEE